MRRARFWRGVFVAVFASAVWAGAVAAQGARPIYTLQADGLACPFCANGIEKQLGAIEGVEAVETDIKSGTVIVTMQDGATLDETTARKAVEAAGFTLRAFKRAETAE